jgi:hypothetical protein
MFAFLCYDLLTALHDCSGDSFVLKILESVILFLSEILSDT